MIMMISKFYFKQKILGGGGVNDLLWGVIWVFWGAFTLRGYIGGGGVMGGPLKYRPPSNGG